jgi:hypothetical protein
MSEFFIVGKPRGGKSFLATKYIYEQLLKDKGQVLRPIVTNIKLNFDEIAAELKQDLKLEYTPDLRNRIRILDDAETGEFWLYTVGREFLKRKTIKMRNWEFDVPDFEDRGKEGCLYVIDEVHIYFPAVFGTRNDNEDDLRFFLTQHGKMNFDIICVTQHPEQVSKQFRRLCQEYMHVRNLSREPIYGFRIGNMFRYVRSLNSPGSMNPAVFDSGFHQMDFKKYGKMYDTTQGVGIAGSLIHEPEKRGRHLAWLIVPIAAFAYFLFWMGCQAPHQLLNLSKSMSKRVEAKVQGNKPTNTFNGGDVFHLMPRTSSGTSSGPPESKPGVSAARLSPGESVKTLEVTVTGWYLVAGTVQVFLSDGRQADSRYHEVDWLSRTNAICFGQSFRVAPLKETLRPLVIPTAALHELVKPVAQHLPIGMATNLSDVTN